MRVRFAMSNLGAFHLFVAVTALASGATVLLLPAKGGRRHRWIGWVYVVAMVLTNVTALSIYRLFGGFGPFHVAATVSLVSVVLGTLAAIGARRARQRRDPVARERAVRRHYRAITFSYIGLMAAFASEIAVRLPVVGDTIGRGLAFALTVLAASLLVVVIGVRLVRSRASSLLAPFVVRADAR